MSLQIIKCKLYTRNHTIQPRHLRNPTLPRESQISYFCLPSRESQLKKSNFLFSPPEWIWAVLARELFKQISSNQPTFSIRFATFSIRFARFSIGARGLFGQGLRWAKTLAKENKKWPSPGRESQKQNKKWPLRESQFLKWNFLNGRGGVIGFRTFPDNLQFPYQNSYL